MESPHKDSKPDMWVCVCVCLYASTLHRPIWKVKFENGLFFETALIAHSKKYEPMYRFVTSAPPSARSLS